MGKKKRAWQDRDYVLRYFGQRERESRRGYISFVSKGVEEGSRADLVGGGLLRSVGGWKGLKELGISPSAVSKSIGRGQLALRNEAIEEYLLESQ